MGTGTPGAPDWSLRSKVPFWKFIERDYHFFGALCGVRGGSPTISAAKGIPDDASSLTRYLTRSWGINGHNYHYCSMRDFVRAKIYSDEDIAEAAASKLKGNDPVIEFLGMNQYECEDLDLLRVCFWFDC